MTPEQIQALRARLEEWRRVNFLCWELDNTFPGCGLMPLRASREQIRAELRAAQERLGALAWEEVWTLFQEVERLEADAALGRAVQALPCGSTIRIDFDDLKQFGTGRDYAVTVPSPEGGKTGRAGTPEQALREAGEGGTA